MGGEISTCLMESLVRVGAQQMAGTNASFPKFDLPGRASVFCGYVKARTMAADVLQATTLLHQRLLWRGARLAQQALLRMKALLFLCIHRLFQRASIAGPRKHE